MSVSDEVRNYCLKNVVDPARTRGEYGVFIRAGDIHAALKLDRKLPLVCSALGANEFETMANIKRIYINGPLNGSSTLFVYIL